MHPWAPVRWQDALIVSLVAGTNELIELKRSLGVPPSGNVKSEVLLKRICTWGIDSLTIRYFFLVVFNMLLFPTTSNNIMGKDAVLTKDLDNFGKIG